MNHFRKDCSDIPIGTVRGPWKGSWAGQATGGVDFMVNGPNGWIPFKGPWNELQRVKKQAEDYAARLRQEMENRP